MLDLRYYLTAGRESPFEAWFSGLDAMAAAKVTTALVRLGQGNTSNRIDWGPGYRIYFGRDGATLLILLTGGTKQRQARDIANAKDYWADYKRRRRAPAR
jgi:putative addiction module killer protein